MVFLIRFKELREVGYEGSVASFPPQMTRPMTHPLVPVAMANGYPEFAGSFPVPVDDDFGMGEDPDGTDASRPFRCEICNTAFRFQGHLDRHMRPELAQMLKLEYILKEQNGNFTMSDLNQKITFNLKTHF